MAYVQRFVDWSDLLDLVRQTGPKDSTKADIYLSYRAPLDYHPVLVHIVRAFKNGKIRIHTRDLKFTADSGHLDRFVKSLRESDNLTATEERGE